jgi:Mg-chelatase subunit ChlD
MKKPSLKFSTLWKFALAVGAGALIVALAGQIDAQEQQAAPKDAPAVAAEEKPKAEVAPEKKDDRPHIEMAILLDTSGSMQGLIDQARTQLWKIVNEFATAERNGQKPDLKVAVYEYGKSTLPASENWVRLVVPLTDDLDTVSEKLFALDINGGEEYCGAAIQRAVTELGWSKRPRDLKCIFIAGNEPFTQGPIDYKKACAAAAAENITVSTIHCGDHEEGIQTAWAEGAKLADGSYMSINHNALVPDIKAPQDEELAKLNTELNKTYVAYGNKKVREEALDRQVAQDSNAEKANLAAQNSRIQFKASGLYSNARWDLCDAYCEGKVKLEDLKDDELPDELKKLKPEERKAFIENMVAQRKNVQQQITKLAKDRDVYVANERKKLAADGDNTLDKAVIDAARQQAEKLQFKFQN